MGDMIRNEEARKTRIASFAILPLIFFDYVDNNNKKSIVIHLTLSKTLERVSAWESSSNPGLSPTNNVTLDKSSYFFSQTFFILQ